MTRRRPLQLVVSALAAFCLVLCVLLVGLRVVCFFGAIGVQRITEAKSIRDGGVTRSRQRAIAIESGTLSFVHVHARDMSDTASESVTWDWHWYQPDAATPTLNQSQAPQWIDGLGVQWRFIDRSGGRYVYTTAVAIVPLWMPIIVSAALSAAFWRAGLAARRRAALGRCAKCGYDLRASPERCPECGAALSNPIS